MDMKLSLRSLQRKLWIVANCFHSSVRAHTAFTDSTDDFENLCVQCCMHTRLHRQFVFRSALLCAHTRVHRIDFTSAVAEMLLVLSLGCTNTLLFVLTVRTHLD